MPNNSPTRADLDQMVDGFQNNKESANKFLDSVNTALDGKDAKDRAIEVQYLVAKLEKEGKLPQLILNSGMADAESTNFRATTFNGKEIRKDEITKIGDTGKNGPMKFDAATQVLALAISKNFDQMDKQTTWTSGMRYSDINKPDGKLSPAEVKKWFDEATRTGVKVDGNKVESPISQYVNVMRQFDTPAKLKAAFGTETPSRDEIKKALDRQQEIQNVLNSVGPEVTEAARKNGRLWSLDTKAAVEYLANENNYDRIQGAKDESWKPFSSGDWISADKIKELGKDTYKVTLEGAAAKDQQKVQTASLVEDLGKKLDAKSKEAAPPQAKPKEEGAKPTAEEDRLRKENEALKQKQAETDAKFAALQKQLAELIELKKNEGKPPEVKKEEPKKEEAKKEEPKKKEEAPAPKPKEPDFKKKEEEEREALRKLFEGR